MAITRFQKIHSAAVSRKTKRLAIKKRKRLAAMRPEASAVVVEPASFKMRLLRGAGGIAFAVAAVPFRLLLSNGSVTAHTKASESTESKYKRKIAVDRRREALRDMARAEYALSMARIELDHADAKLAKLEKSTAPPSLWSRVSTAAMYVGAGAVMGYYPDATYAVASAAAIAGRYALDMAF